MVGIVVVMVVVVVVVCACLCALVPAHIVLANVGSLSGQSHTAMLEQTPSPAISSSSELCLWPFPFVFFERLRSSGALPRSRT